MYFGRMKWYCIVGLVICCFSSTIAQHVFSINDFQATSEAVALVGNAKLFGDRVRITSANENEQGACWYATKQISLDNGFETEFKFLISGKGNRGGDGFAFIMQDQRTDVVGGTGDAIGYKNIPFVMAIEFDTKDDNEGSDNHVNLSFYDGESRSYRRYATVHEIPEITDGKPHFTKIIYTDGELQVFLDSYIFPILSVKIDIGAKIQSDDNWAWMGFTSSTSSSFANHDLLQWTLREFAGEPVGIEFEDIDVFETKVFDVTERKLRIRVWDHNTIDGDIISLKWGDQWVLTEYELSAEPHQFEVTVHGFAQNLTLYANNVGMVPPNTAMISVFDGDRYFEQQLNADLKTSESLTIRFSDK